MAAPWLLTSITRLASHVTRWSLYHDKALRRLMSFVANNSHLTLRSQLSTADAKIAKLHCWSDADLAGDHSTTRSTSGMFLAMVSEDGNRSWPISWGSKKQPTTASSTCEAETLSILSLSIGLRKEAIPMLSLLEVLLNRPVQLICFEDN